MKDAIRVVLIDPAESSRNALLPLLDQVEGILLAEVCPRYESAFDRVAEILPDIALVVADADRVQSVALIETINRETPEVAILPASQIRDGAWILSLIRAGAREFLPLPAELDQLTEAFQRLAEPGAEPVAAAGGGPKLEEAAPKATKVIAVTGAMGDVGSTMIAVNLATTLAKFSGKEVVLADFDLLFGSVDAHLDLVTENSLQEIVNSGHRLDSTLLKRMLARHSSGLYVLSRPLHLQDAAQLLPESLRLAVDLLKGGFPLVVIDTSKNLLASDFVAFEAADVIMVVVQFEPACLQNTARLLDCFRQVGDLADRVQVIANRVGSQLSVVQENEAVELLKTPITWRIPNATKVFHPAEDKGVPIETIAPKSDAQRAIASIARSVGPFPEPKGSKPSLGFFRDRLRPK